jgi:NAD+ synthase (glutamine-hydrolysing)
MKLIKVAGATLNQTPLDWQGNRANILGAIDAAIASGVGVLCLPELCTCGYGCEDALSSPELRRRCRHMIADIADRTRQGPGANMVISLGLPVLFRNALFNCAALLAGGRIVGLVAKRHLAGEGLHYEPRWFKPWPAGVRAEVDFDGETVPIGDLWFDFHGPHPHGGLSLGFEICEDAWVASRPGAALSRRGVDLILNPSASHFAFGKLETRRRFVLEGSRAFGATYIYSNLVGNEAGRAIYDGGVLIASAGDLIAQGPRLAFEAFSITTAVIDVDRQRTAQARTASFEPDVRPDPSCVRVPFDILATDSPINPPIAAPAWESSPTLKEEEFTRAVSLGLFDYLRKSHMRGFVVSLSGGADSAAVVSLVHTMTALGVDALGLEGFRSRLPSARLTGTSTPTLVHELLTTVYQSSDNSSQLSRESARTVAAAFGARHVDFDIEPLVRAYTALGESAENRPLTWERDDLTLQNIQARVRGPAAWLLANINNALLLATSNRSEAAVGYATMDGDTCGGLSPIAGIDKAFLLRWLRWMQSTGPAGLGPIRDLDVIVRRTPTPELRPASMNQTSEGDLMPYEVLEAIEDAAIGGKQSPGEVFAVLKATFPAYPESTLLAWVDRFFTLWCRNQWKRERYAPSFHLDDHNLDPKTWCRFPILSGGFATELRELRERAAEGGKGGGA